MLGMHQGTKQKLLSSQSLHDKDDNKDDDKDNDDTEDGSCPPGA